MQEAFQHLDTLNGFRQLYDAWRDENSENWHSRELKKSLDRINDYVDQLASYLSGAHHDIEQSIQVEPGQLARKQFATVVKRTEEWKALRKWVERDWPLDNQPVTVEAILRCCIEETKKFISKV